MVKTHKSPQIAFVQLDSGASGILTATLNKALTFASYGINDITLAYPVFGLKIKKLELLARQVSLTVTIDSIDVHEQLFLNLDSDVFLKILIKIDSGLGRLGIDPDSVRKIFSDTRCNLKVIPLDVTEQLEINSNIKQTKNSNIFTRYCHRYFELAKKKECYYCYTS